MQPDQSVSVNGTIAQGRTGSVLSLPQVGGMGDSSSESTDEQQPLQPQQQMQQQQQPQQQQAPQTQPQQQWPPQPLQRPTTDRSVDAHPGALHRLRQNGGSFVNSSSDVFTHKRVATPSCSEMSRPETGIDIREEVQLLVSTVATVMHRLERVQSALVVGRGVYQRSSSSASGSFFPPSRSPGAPSGPTPKKKMTALSIALGAGSDRQTVDSSSVKPPEVISPRGAMMLDKARRLQGSRFNLKTMKANQQLPRRSITVPLSPRRAASVAMDEVPRLSRVISVSDTVSHPAEHESAESELGDLKKLFAELDVSKTGVVGSSDIAKYVSASSTDSVQKVVYEACGVNTLHFADFQRLFSRLTWGQPVLMKALSAPQQFAAAFSAALRHSDGVNAFMQQAQARTRMLRPDTSLRWCLQAWVLLCTLIDVLDAALSAASLGWYSSGCGEGFSAPGFYASVVMYSCVSTAAFSLEIALTFLSMSRTGWQLVEEPVEVRGAYLRGWFFFDFVLAMPLELAAALADDCTVFRVFRIPKALRVIRVPRLFESASPLGEKPKSILLLLFMFWTLSAVGWLSAFWALLRPPEESTFQQMDTVTSAFYFTITTITSVGYGDITPDGVSERWFACLVQVLGVMFMVFVGAYSTAFLLETDPITVAMKDRRRRFASVIRDMEIPWELQLQCFEVLPSIVESTSARHSEFLDELPHSMRQQIESFVKVRMVKKVPLFRLAGIDALLAIAGSLRKRLVGPSEYLIRKGETGSEMYIILHGVVEVTVPSETGDRNVATLRNGSWFGEIALLCDTVRSCSVRSVTACNLFVLDKLPFLQIVSSSPDFEKAVREELERRSLPQNPLRPEEPSTFSGMLDLMNEDECGSAASSEEPMQVQLPPTLKRIAGVGKPSWLQGLSAADAVATVSGSGPMRKDVADALIEVLSSSMDKCAHIAGADLLGTAGMFAEKRYAADMLAYASRTVNPSLLMELWRVAGPMRRSVYNAFAEAAVQCAETGTDDPQWADHTAALGNAILSSCKQDRADDAVHVLLSSQALRRLCSVSDAL